MKSIYRALEALALWFAIDRRNKRLAQRMGLFE